ncbi:MAG: hypothetical protein AAB582_03365 [Patescibacteria group bacterium]
MPLVFSDEEIAKVTARYPRLARIDSGTVEGILDLNAVYDGKTLTDNFHIRITAFNPNSERVPALYEIGGRTEAIAKKWNMSDLRDLHRNPNGTACVCVKQLEKEKFPPGSNLFTFVEQLVVPYLYGLSHYESSKTWLWGEFSHGGLGLLEFYADRHTPQTVEDISEILPSIRKELNWKEYHKQLRSPSAKRACLCGSGKPFGRCHSKAWKGLGQLTAEIERLGLNTRSLFI